MGVGELLHADVQVRFRSGSLLVVTSHGLTCMLRYAPCAQRMATICFVRSSVSMLYSIGPPISGDVSYAPQCVSPAENTL